VYYANTVIGNAANSGTFTVEFPRTASTIPASAATITGLTAPVVGIVPSTDQITGPGYTGEVTWATLAGVPLPPNTPFAPGTTYKATVTIVPAQGFTTSGMAENTFKVPGATATQAAGSNVVTVTFPMTQLLSVDIRTIPGLTAPAAKASPVPTISTTQYTGQVSWSSSPSRFDYDTVYTATISLTARQGYTFTGVEGNFFFVAGAQTVINAAGSGDKMTVTVTFPATAQEVITSSFSIGEFFEDMDPIMLIAIISIPIIAIGGGGYYAIKKRKP